MLTFFCIEAQPLNTQIIDTWTDQNDGTIRRLTKKKDTHPCFGFEFYTETFFKKCLQGQVFRKEYNDCKGISTSPYWGAQTLQFCNNNDFSCQKATQYDAQGNPLWGLPDHSVSPAGISCSNDFTSNKIWKMAETSFVRESNTNIIPDFPKTETDFIWYGGISPLWEDESLHRAFLFYPYGENYFLKNSFQYVLCVTEEKKL